jgi:hypothetical protein
MWSALWSAAPASLKHFSLGTTPVHVWAQALDLRQLSSAVSDLLLTINVFTPIPALANPRPCLSVKRGKKLHAVRACALERNRVHAAGEFHTGCRSGPLCRRMPLTPVDHPRSRRAPPNPLSPSWAAAHSMRTQFQWSLIARVRCTLMRLQAHEKAITCQSAFDWDPLSASKRGSDAYSMIVFVFMARQSA